MSKRQSPTTVLLRTPTTQIFFNQGIETSATTFVVWSYKPPPPSGSNSHTMLRRPNKAQTVVHGDMAQMTWYCESAYGEGHTSGLALCLIYSITRTPRKKLHRTNRTKTGFREHRDVEKNHEGACKPVARHFHFPNHCTLNMTICGLSLLQASTMESHENPPKDL